MFFYSYINDTVDNCGVCDSSKPIIVNGCGEQRITQDLFCSRQNGLRDYLMMYVYSGYANYLIDGSMKRIPAGNIVLYRPDNPQEMRYLASELPVVYWVHFTGYEASSLLSDCSMADDSIKVFNIGINDEIPRYFLKLIALLKESAPSICLNAELMQIFSSIAKRLLPVRKNNPPLNISKAVQALKENISSDFTCKELALMCNLSESHFMHSFKKWAGVSPKLFQLNLRMDYARELLFLTQLPVGEIASRVGYENPLYFSRLFKKYNGVSPSEYRIKKGQQTETI